MRNDARKALTGEHSPFLAVMGKEFLRAKRPFWPIGEIGNIFFFWIA